MDSDTLHDSHWLVVLNTVLVAEQIGGSGGLHLSVVFTVESLQSHVGRDVGKQLNEQTALLDAQNLGRPGGRLRRGPK